MRNVSTLAFSNNELAIQILDAICTSNVTIREEDLKQNLNEQGYSLEQIELIKITLLELRTRGLIKINDEKESGNAYYTITQEGLTTLLISAGEIEEQLDAQTIDQLTCKIDSYKNMLNRLAKIKRESEEIKEAIINKKTRLEKALAIMDITHI